MLYWKQEMPGKNSNASGCNKEKNMKKKIRYIFFWGMLIFLAESHAEAREPADSLNSAGKVSYLTIFEKDVVLELNKVRSDPSHYATEILNRLHDAYQGKTFTFPGQLPVTTQEGVKALDECIDVLKKTDSMPVLLPSEGLSKAAQMLVEDQQNNGGVGHFGKEKSSPQNRIDQFGSWWGMIGENIAYGSQTPQMIVVSLLIDDGVPNRGHRYTILNDNFKQVGIAVGTHPDYRTICVMDFATSFETKNDTQKK